MKSYTFLLNFTATEVFSFSFFLFFFFTQQLLIFFFISTFLTIPAMFRHNNIQRCEQQIKRKTTAHWALARTLQDGGKTGIERWIETET